MPPRLKPAEAGPPERAPPVPATAEVPPGPLRSSRTPSALRDEVDGRSEPYQRARRGDERLFQDRRIGIGRHEGYGGSVGVEHVLADDQRHGGFAYGRVGGEQPAYGVASRRAANSPSRFTRYSARASSPASETAGPPRRPGIAGGVDEPDEAQQEIAVPYRYAHPRQQVERRRGRSAYGQPGAGDVEPGEEGDDLRRRAAAQDRAAAYLVEGLGLGAVADHPLAAVLDQRRAADPVGDPVHELLQFVPHPASVGTPPHNFRLGRKTVGAKAHSVRRMTKVAVVGAGIVGAASALACALRGLSVTVTSAAA